MTNFDAAELVSISWGSPIAQTISPLTPLSHPRALYALQDAGFTTLAAGMSFLIHSTLKAREQIIRTLDVYLSTHLCETSTAVQQIYHSLTDLGLSRDDVVRHIWIFMFATLASGPWLAAWMGWHLAANLKVKAQLVDEIRGAYADKVTGGLPSYVSDPLDFSSVPTVVPFVEEVMRLQATPSMSRAIHKDSSLTTSDGSRFQLRKGDTVLGASWWLHQSEAYWALRSRIRSRAHGPRKGTLYSRRGKGALPLGRRRSSVPGSTVRRGGIARVCLRVLGMFRCGTVRNVAES